MFYMRRRRLSRRKCAPSKPSEFPQFFNWTAEQPGDLLFILEFSHSFQWDIVEQQARHLKLLVEYAMKGFEQNKLEKMFVNFVGDVLNEKNDILKYDTRYFL